MNNGYNQYGGYGIGGYFPPRPQQNGGHFAGQNPWCQNGSQFPGNNTWQPRCQQRQDYGYQQDQQPFQGINMTHGQHRPQYAHQGGQYSPNNVTNRGNYNHVNNRKNKQHKVEKRDKPENNKFFCDSCDRVFALEDKFQEHVSQHEKCSVPSCSYIAAPKLVKMHFQMQHKSGFARKIWQQESKEDIDKWIQDRKRNFPTASNIALKDSAEKQREDRGEKINTKSFGKMRGGHNNNNRHGKQWKNKKRHFEETDSSDKESMAKKQKEQNGLESGHTLNPESADPLSAILDKPETPSATDDKPNGLASIMSSYVDHSDTEEPKSANIKKDDVKVMHNKHPKKKQNNAARSRNPRHPTLLERLLAKEIRHERNVILQCVHFIVKRNFFDKHINSENQEASEEASKSQLGE